MAKPDRDQLLEIFNALKKEMKPYEQGNIIAREDGEEKYDLWSGRKGMVILGKTRLQMSFVTIVIQGSYVGFYYMPIYTNCDAITDKLSPGLLKCLKGKACFHIKTMDKEMLGYIKEAMKVGYEMYQKNGWV